MKISVLTRPCVLWLILLSQLSGSALAEDSARKPVPNDAAVAEAVKIVQEVYRNDYQAKIKTDKFIKQLIADGTASNDNPAVSYVLLEEAAAFAVEKENIRLALNALSALSRSFALEDYAERKAKILDSFARKAKKGMEAYALASAYLVLAGEALENNLFDLANKAVKNAEKFAKKNKDKEQTQEAKEIKSQIAEQEKAFKQTAKALQSLKDNPDDPAINLTCGRYHCLTRGEWEKGLPLLVKSGDQTLSALAAKELASPQKADELLDIGDAWWNLTKKEKLSDECVDNLRQHACEMYEKALPMAVGFDRAKIEARIKSVSNFPPIVWRNSIGIQLVRIPAGEFLMGLTPEEKDKFAARVKTAFFRNLLDGCVPQHKVRISYDFLMGKYEVTVKDFALFIEETKHQVQTDKGSVPITMVAGGFKSVPGLNWENPGFAQTDKHPVVCISWQDAKAFCTWLNQKDKSKPKGWRYRLPTEAEWEYAARGSKNLYYPWGNEWKEGCAFTNIAGKTKADKDTPLTAPVGSYGKAGESPFGVCDMLGNIWEFCEDCHGANFYANSPEKDPFNKKSSGRRVVRGGSAIVEETVCSNVFRAGDAESYTEASEGFRIVLVPESAP
jgi:formylglycine-generating enzyme required for sulfatase activity